MPFTYFRKFSLFVPDSLHSEANPIPFHAHPQHGFWLCAGYPRCSNSGAPNILPSLRLIWCAAFARRAAVRRAAIDRYHLPAGSQQQTLLLWHILGQTDRRTDTVPFHRPRSAYYTGSANNKRTTDSTGNRSGWPQNRRKNSQSFPP